MKRLVALGHGREAVSRQKLWGSIGCGATTFIVGKLIDDRAGMEMEQRYLPMFWFLAASSGAFIIGLWLLLPNDKMINDEYEEMAEGEVCLEKKGVDESLPVELDEVKEATSLNTLIRDSRFLALLFTGFIVGYCMLHSH